MTLFHIKINTNKENMAKGFSTLLKSGTSVFCLKNEEYVINDIALHALKDGNISFYLISQK